MKKLLALVLALVMTLGLATVGANAALKDYSDAASISEDHETAFAVMNAVGVFQGSDGKLAPTANLTRAQAAKIIAYLSLGEKTAEALPAVQVFDDVPASHWAAKYIAYGKEAGILQSNGGNNFDPDGALTGYMFGAYMLAVLGYDRSIEGMTGSNWAIKTATLMEANEINADVDKVGSAVLTREEAAQYAFNTLKSDMVWYNGGTTVTVAGVPVTTGGTRQLATAGGYGNYPGTYAATWDATDGTYAGARATNLQLGEKLYGAKLKPVTGTNDLGETIRTWYYKDNGTANAPVLADSEYELTTGVTHGKTFVVSSISGQLNTLDGQILAQNDKYVTGTNTNPGNKVSVANSNFDDSVNQTAATEALLIVNGREAAEATGGGANKYTPSIGDVIEIYTVSGAPNNISKVVVYSYSLMKITKVDTNVSAADKAATPAVSAYLTITNGTTSRVYKDTAIEGYDAATYVKDAYLAAVISEVAGTTALLDSEVITGAQGKVTSYRTNNNYTVGGTAYSKLGKYFANYNKYTADDFTGTYAMFTDKNGTGIGIDVVEVGQVSSEAKYITALWRQQSTAYGSETNYTYYAQVVGMDGTVENIVIGLTSSDGQLLGTEVVYGGAPAAPTGTTYTYTRASISAATQLTTTHYYLDQNGLGHANGGAGNYVPAGGTGAPVYPKTGDSATTVPFYTRVTNEVQVGGFYTISETTNGYYSLKHVATTTSRFVQDAKSTDLGTIAVNQGTSATAIRTTSTRLGDSTNTYITDNTRFVVVSGTGSLLKTAVFTGKTNIGNADNNVDVIATKSGNTYEANYVIITSTSAASSGNLDDMVYVSSNPATANVTDDGSILTVYDMNGEKQTITVKSVTGVSKGGFYKFSKNASDIYTLDTTTVQNSLNGFMNTGTAAVWDYTTDKGVTGAANAVYLNRIYSGKISVQDAASGATSYLYDINTDKLTAIVDLHETDDRAYHYNSTQKVYNWNVGLETYAGTITSVADLANVPSGYVVELQLYVNEDGAKLIYVTDIYRNVMTLTITTDLQAASTVTAISTAVSNVTRQPAGAGTNFTTETIALTVTGTPATGDVVTVTGSLLSGSFTAASNGVSSTTRGAGTWGAFTNPTIVVNDQYGNAITYTLSIT